jgi:hypothetical protein
MRVSEVVSTGHSSGLGQLLVRLSVAPARIGSADSMPRPRCPGRSRGILALVKANDPCLSGDRVTWSGMPQEVVPHALRYIAQKISAANRQAPD